MDFEEIIRLHTDQISRLEKQNRRLKFVVLPIVAFMLIGWTVAKEYSTYEGQFFLRDKLGNMRGSLSYNPNNNLGQFALGISGDNNVDGTFRFISTITLGHRPDNQQPFLRISDQNGNMRVYLGVGSNGKTFLQLGDDNGDVYWSAPSK